MKILSALHSKLQNIILVIIDEEPTSLLLTFQNMSPANNRD